MSAGVSDRQGVDDDILDTLPIAEINITPLVDVMLVLLIIFMVAAPLMVHGVPVDLPSNSGTPLGRPTKPLIVSLTRGGLLYLRDERLALDELVRRLHAMHDSDGDLTVYVRADRAVAYGEVMDLMGRLGEGGVLHVSLLSQPGPAGGAR